MAAKAKPQQSPKRLQEPVGSVVPPTTEVRETGTFNPCNVRRALCHVNKRSGHRPDLFPGIFDREKCKAVQCPSYGRCSSLQN